MNVARTLLPESAAKRSWDVVVIGAGPAGCLAAIELAGRGASVLLVERKTFPRDKVCGCCLNRRSVAGLAEIGLPDLVQSFGALPIDRFVIRRRQRVTKLAIEGGVSLSRARLDAELARVAIGRGVEFLPEVSAQLGDCDPDGRFVQLTSTDGEYVLKTRAVIAADGIGGRVLARSDDDPGWISETSLVGIGAKLPGDAVDVEGGAILMALGDAGYVGLTRVEDGQINVAAAIHPQAIKDHGGTGTLIAHQLQECGIEIQPSLLDAQWRGTGALTRRSGRLGAERVFVVGDAAGYIEPFTGQGIAWAIDSGRRVASVTHKVVQHGWSPEDLLDWTRSYESVVTRHQRLCRTLSWGLRSSALVRFGLETVQHFPAIARPIARSLDW